MPEAHHHLKTEDYMTNGKLGTGTVFSVHCRKMCNTSFVLGIVMITVNVLGISMKNAYAHSSLHMPPFWIHLQSESTKKHGQFNDRLSTASAIASWLSQW
jgi:hypothetical protein